MPRPSTTLARHVFAAAFLALAVVGVIACGDASGPVADLADRETFVATYVDLRVAAIGAEGGELTDELRTAVLTRNGVTEEQLYAFVEYHGEDLPFMRDVWNDVETRLEAQTGAGDPRTNSGSAPGRN